MIFLFSFLLIFLNISPHSQFYICKIPSTNRKNFIMHSFPRGHSDISPCKHVELTPQIFEPSPKTLKINDSLISNLNLLNNIKNLEQIELISCYILTMPVLDNLRNLSLLRIEQNFITHLNQSNYFSKSIKFLYLINNGISVIKNQTFANLVNLEILDLSLNKIIHLDLEFNVQQPKELKISLASNNPSKVIDFKRLILNSDKKIAVSIDCKGSNFKSLPIFQNYTKSKKKQFVFYSKILT